MNKMLTGTISNERMKLYENILNFYKNVADSKDKQDAVIIIANSIICCIDGMTDSPEKVTDHVADELKSAIEFISEGKNTAIADDRGIPSIMVKYESYFADELDSSFQKQIHPAFQLKNKALKEVYVSKYLNFIFDNRAYSFPFMAPSEGIGFKDAVSASTSKGEGWNLSYYALRAAIALKASKQGYLPRGNCENGHDFFHKDEKGILVKGGLVTTGSGPLTWSHDHSEFGIYDLCGNLNEWDLGLQLCEGEIQIIPNADSLLDSTKETDAKEYWRAIMPDGKLVEPKSKGTLKYSNNAGGIVMTDSDEIITKENFGCALKDISAKEGLQIPQIVKLLALYPIDSLWNYGYGWRWANGNQDCAPLSGGAYRALDHAGIYFTGMTYSHSHEYSLTGFRSVYWNK